MPSAVMPCNETGLSGGMSVAKPKVEGRRERNKPQITQIAQIGM